MPRLPYAARRLVEDIHLLRPKAKVEMTPVGDADGLDVYRTFVFNKATVKWLAPIIEGVDDRRIVGSGVNDKGLLEVIFSHRSIADDRSPFRLTEAGPSVSGD